MTDWSKDPPVLSRRTYLIMKACETGAGVFLALEAVASTAIEHPEWNMAEAHTWDEWERGVTA